MSGVDKKSLIKEDEHRQTEVEPKAAWGEDSGPRRAPHVPPTEKDAVIEIKRKISSTDTVRKSSESRLLE